MSIKINAREIPEFHFRAVLPEWLGPGGEECFIEISARAAGAMNPAYTSAIEKALYAAQIEERKLSRCKDDAEWVEKNAKAGKDLALANFAAIYDACVIEWSTNIQDDGHDLAPTRESFLGLADVRVAAVANALTAFEERCRAAGEDGEAVIEDEEKN